MDSTLDKIEKLIQWKKQIDNKIAELQRELSATPLEQPQWNKYVDEQEEPETIINEELTGAQIKDMR